MTPDEFIDHLREVIPNKNALIKAGLKEKFADNYIKEHHIEARSDRPFADTYGDAMLESLNIWDLSNMAVGVLHFFKEFNEDNGYVSLIEEFNESDEFIGVGTDDGDVLAFHIQSKSYVLLDHERHFRSYYDVAPNGNALLECLATMVEYFARIATYIVDGEDEVVGWEVKSKCVKILGGPKYEVFCRSILGW